MIEILFGKSEAASMKAAKSRLADYFDWNRGSRCGDVCSSAEA